MHALYYNVTYLIQELEQHLENGMVTIKERLEDYEKEVAIYRFVRLEAIIVIQ